MNAPSPKYNLFELQEAYAEALSSAYLKKNPRLAQRTARQMSSDAIRELFTKAAAELTVERVYRVAVNGVAFVPATLVATMRSVPAVILGELILLVCGTALALQLRDTVRVIVMRVNQFDEDNNLKPNAPGDKRIHALAAAKIENLIIRNGGTYNHPTHVM